jgi:hypothetical protein
MTPFTRSPISVAAWPMSEGKYDSREGEHDEVHQHPDRDAIGETGGDPVTADRGAPEMRHDEGPGESEREAEVGHRAEARPFW